MTTPTINIVYAQPGSGAMNYLVKKIREEHYLHCMPSPYSYAEGYLVYLSYGQPTNVPFQTSHTGLVGPVGGLIFGRPQATSCGQWYGKLEDYRAGLVEVTQWQVLNLARVWIHPAFQNGGACYDNEYLPGFIDRKGRFQSTLASAILKQTITVIGYEYLMVRPPVWIDDPFEIQWLLSYCDTNLHKGTIYKTAGFELFDTNAKGIQTWRIRLPSLTLGEIKSIEVVSAYSPRSIRLRAQRSSKYQQAGWLEG